MYVFILNKTKCMCIKPKGMNDLCFPKMYPDNNPVKVVKRDKYLDLFMIDNGSEYRDILRQMRGIHARGNSLIRNVKTYNDEIKSFVKYLSHWFIL